MKREFTTKELANFKLPGFPGTTQGWDKVVKSRGWLYLESHGRGRGGVRREYQPPQEVIDLIEKRLRGELPEPAAIPKKDIVKKQQPGYLSVPLYNDSHAAAGRGAVVEGREVADGSLMFGKDWIRRELSAKPEDLRSIRVSGDSMEPKLRSGDVVLIDTSSRRPDREGIYILRMGDMLLVKQLQAIPSGIIKVTSENPAFDSWTLKLSDLEGDAPEVAIVGRVIWAGRRY